MWYSLYDSATGALVSSTNTLPVNIPANMSYLTLADKPANDQMWDATTRTYIARPLKVLVDRLQDIINNPNYADDIQLVWSSLNATQKTRLRNGLIKLLGAMRYRADLEPVELVKQ